MNLIHSIEISLLSFPLTKPFSNHAHPLTQINGIEVRIFTEDNMGCSFIYGLHKSPYINIVQKIKSDIIPALFKIPDNSKLPMDWHTFWTNYKNENRNQEKLFALAAVDIAIWDLFTKKKGVSVHNYLGAAQKVVPTYGTTGWLSFSINELISECQSYKEQGINAFKIRLGHIEDLLRVKTLRDKMGKDYILMADANQRYSAEKSAQISQDLLSYNILWLEEPTNYLDEQLIKIKKDCKIPIALGENILDENEFKKICVQHLTDYLQPDLPRCGGITGFIQAAEIALKNKIPLCSHLMPQLSISLVAAFQNGVWVEYDNLLPENIFIHPFSVQNGMMKPPLIPGTGVELKQESLEKYRTNLEIFNGE